MNKESEEIQRQKRARERERERDREKERERAGERKEGEWGGVQYTTLTHSHTLSMTR